MNVKVLSRLVGAAAAAVVCWAGTAGAQVTPNYTWYGDGSATTFTISTEAQLVGLANIVNYRSGVPNTAREEFIGKTVRLGADIALTADFPAIGGSYVWSGGGSGGLATYVFKGTFNGRGYRITGLNAASTATLEAGLFGNLGEGGVICSVHVSGSVSASKNYAGGIVARNNGGRVHGSSFSGTVASANTYTGGIVGYNENGGIVENVYNAGNTSDGTYTGGIVGYNTATVQNAYNTGKITGNIYAGGIVGTNLESGIVKNTYNIGEVISGTYAGGIVGANNGGEVSSCVSLGLKIESDNTYYIGRVLGYNSGFAGSNKARADLTVSTLYPNDAEMQGASVTLGTVQSSVFSGWSTSVWSYNSSGGLSSCAALPALRGAPQSPAPTLPSSTGCYAVTVTAPTGGTLSVTNASAGDAAVASGTIVPGNTVLFIETAPSAGYDFTRLTVNGTNYTTVSRTHTVTAATAISAVFTVKSYTVTFNSNGGTPTPTAQTVNHGALVMRPSEPTRTGHTFAGWFTAETSGNQWSFTTNTVTATTTLYARWTQITYTVTFNPNGGTPTPASQTVNHGATVTQPSNPTRAGYTFAGWWTAATGGNQWSFTTNTVTATTTLYARWTQITYTVTFNPNGGTPTPASQTVNHGAAATQPSAPTLAGHTFAGWFTAQTGGSQWTFATNTVTADITLWARWTPITYTVTFNSNSGTPTPASQTVNHGALVTQPSNPTRAGYTFAGWWTAETGGAQWNFATGTVTAATTLWARWTLDEPEVYTVTWSADGGTPAPAQVTVTHGGSVTDPAAMTKTRYAFDGWYYNANFSGAAVTFPITNVTGNVTLYAKWTLNSYWVTWDTDGGVPAPTQESVDSGGSITAPAAMTKAGYEFGGWYNNANFSGAAVTFPITNVAESVTLYAKWAPVDVDRTVYTVAWHADGGAPVPTQTSVVHGDSIINPVAVSKAGYEFGGWYGNADFSGTAAVFPITNVTANTALYAKWTPVVSANVAVTGIADVPEVATVSVPLTLTGTVVPADATNKAIEWSIPSAVAGVFIHDGVLYASVAGTVFVKALIANGKSDGVDYEQIFTITVGTTSVLSGDRVMPPGGSGGDAAVVAPAAASSGGFAAGPNIISKAAGGVVNIYHVGAAFGRPRSAGDNVLTVYDASGNVVKKLSISDNTPVSPPSPPSPQSPGSSRRAVGQWDLRDAKGRPVPEGTYLLRGVMRTADGNRERVSLKVSVR